MSAGHFGIYGGRFVAETLMPLILDLEAAYEAAKAGPGIPRRTGRADGALWRPAEPSSISPSASPSIWVAPRSTSNATSSITPVLTRSTIASARFSWPSAWAKRGSSPRRALVSTAVAVATGRRPARIALRRLHGCHRYRTPKAQRCAHASAWRRGCNPSTSGSGTLKDAMNEALRDWCRQCRRHLLHHRYQSPVPIPTPRWFVIFNP